MENVSESGERVLLSKSASEFCLVLYFLLVGLDEGDCFGEGVIVGLQKSLFLLFAVLQGEVGAA